VPLLNGSGTLELGSAGMRSATGTRRLARADPARFRSDPTIALSLARRLIA
jgi:hypothetical protein